MKKLQETPKNIKVNFFQRRPRKGFSFSLEYIFEDVRNRLKDKIDAKVFISKCYNDGYYTKFINIVEAAFRQGNDVNHITGEIHFLDLLMKKKKVLLTILDCGMMKRKTGVAKKIVQWLYLSAPAARAKIITTISEEAKKEILFYTQCDPEKIKVIPVAIDPLYKPSPKEFNGAKPVILHIGTGYNKNLLRLVEALKGIPCHLIVIGKLSQEQLDALANNEIDYSNEYNISNEDLLKKYHACDILAFVSTFEGFGMPIVEANTVERVVLTSNISSMPEVAADSACLVDPLSVDSIRAGALRLINDAAYRKELLTNGRTNKLRFDADKIADSYFMLYKQLAGK